MTVKFQHRLELAGFHVLIAAISRVRHRRATAIGRRLSVLEYVADAKRRRATLGNLAYVLPEVDESERVRIARETFRNFGGYFLEQLSALRYDPAEFAQRFEIRGEEHLHEARRRGRGVLLMTGHFGPFDLASYPLGASFDGVHGVVRPPSNPLVAERAREIRERSGVKLVPRHRLGQQLYQIMRRGEMAALAIDQRVRPWSGILIDFLGQPAWTSPIPAMLALRTGAVVVPMFMYPATPGRYRFEIHAPIHADGLGDDPEGELTARYLEPLEAEIRRRPEQWMWMHRRWQLVFPRKDPRIRARQRQASGLDQSGSRPSYGGATERQLKAAIRTERLEARSHTLVDGPAEQRTEIAAALIDCALDSGLAARAVDAAATADRLLAAERDGLVGKALRELDASPLLWIRDLHEVREPERRRILARLVGRRGRLGSLILEPSDEPGPEPDDPLARALGELRSTATRIAY